MKNLTLHNIVILIILVSCACLSTQNTQRSHVNSSKKYKLKPTEASAQTEPSRTARHRHKHKERRHEKNRQDPDIHDSSVNGQEGMHADAANHEPLYGSQPPIIAIDDQDYQSKSGSNVHSVNNPHDILYSDQHNGENELLHSVDELLQNSAELTNNRVKVQISGKPSQIPIESLSLDNSVTHRNWNELDITTQGQIYKTNSQENLENSIEFQSQGNWDDPHFLKDLVMDLQEQLKESKTSQRVTRSVLNTLEEKQNAQASDLQILKDEVLNIKKQQRDQTTALTAIQDQVSNNAWGVRNIRDTNGQIKQDLGALKELQLAHNDTMIMLSEWSETNTLEHVDYSDAIRHLQYEMLGLRNQLEEDRGIIYTIQESLLENGNIENLPDAEDNYGREINNNIQIIPSLTDDFSRENSGDGSRSQEYFDELASSIEEKHNVIGDHLSRIIAHEERIDNDLIRMRNRFLFYNSKLAQLSGLYLNTSLQLAEIEKTVLANQNQHTPTGVTSLQEITSSLMNFTNQLVNIQTWHMATKGSVNTTWSNQQTVAEIQTALENHSSRLQGLEDSSNDDFVGLSERVDELDTTVLRCCAKISDLQIRILNDSLEKCEKNSKSLKQEIQIQDLDRGLTKVESRISASADKITKIERGMSKIFELSDKQGHALNRMVGTVEDVGSILPIVSHLQTDMMNLLAQLPADCSELLLRDRSAHSGVYLVHTRGSATSVRLACDFSDDTAWTVIQKRINGHVNFSRIWKEYKNGFGNPETEFWIGNEHLHFLTSQDNYQLQIEMTGLDGTRWWARYDEFHVGDEESMYILELGGFHGNATDAFRYSDGMPFSAIDVDNDVSSTNCAKFYTAGWWYKHCHYANLNGRFTVGIVWFNHDADEWVQMNETVMKIRPLKT